MSKKPSPTGPPRNDPTWTKAERAIRDAIRADIRVACVPRRLDLPPRTIAAVECTPGKVRVRMYMGVLGRGNNLATIPDTWRILSSPPSRWRWPSGT